MADERDLIGFDSEYVLSEVYPDRVDAPNAWRGCSLCGAASTAWPASELTVVNRRHGAQPLGHLAPCCHQRIDTANDWGSSPGGSGRPAPPCPHGHRTIPVATMKCDDCRWTPSR